MLAALLLMIVMISGCTSKKPEVFQIEEMNETSVPTTAAPVFTAPEPSTVYIEIRGSAFNPIEIKVVNGTTVEWKNLDSAVHIINGSGFKSPPINKYSTWSYTFNRTGIFTYNCSSHFSMPRARIIVE